MRFFWSLFLLLSLLTFPATHAVNTQKDDVEEEEEVQDKRDEENEQDTEDEDEETSDGEDNHDVEDMMDKLEAFDADGDQKVSLAEIKNLITKEIKDEGDIPSGEEVEEFVESHMKIFRKVFPESDIDADGFINREEFTSLMQKVDDEQEKEDENEEQNMDDEDEQASEEEEDRDEDLMDKLEAFDADGDMRVSLTEIKDLITKEINEEGGIPSDEEVEKYVESHMKVFRKVFPVSDTDADGFINKEEFIALMENFDDEMEHEEDM